MSIARDMCGPVLTESERSSLDWRPPHKEIERLRDEVATAAQVFSIAVKESSE